jgi:hypothetical protein
MNFLNQKTALFLIPGNSLDTPSVQGFVAHKFDYIVEGFLAQGWRTRFFTDIYTKESTFHTKYKVDSLTLLFLLSVIAIVLKHPMQILKSRTRLSLVNQAALRRTYKYVIEHIRPDVVLAVGASEKLVEVCKEARINCTEIQHGMFEHADLQMYWPRGISPDSFITWDSRSGRIAEEAGMVSWVLGHPDEVKTREVGHYTNGSGEFACVSLGYGASDSEDPWGCFPSSLVKTIDDLIEESTPVLIRLHPLQSVRAIRTLKIKRWILNRFPGVRIDNPRRIPLHESIMSSFCNIAVVSASWYDFALAGKPSCILNEEAASRYKSYAREIQFWESGNLPVHSLGLNEPLSAFLNIARGAEERPGSFSRSTVRDYICTLEKPRLL